MTRFACGLLLAMCLGACVPDAVQDTGTEHRLPVPRFERDSTTADFPVTVPDGYAATTGYLVVLANRERPNGPTLRLPVAIVHARSGRVGASPVLYLVGGPGSSALNAAAYPSAYPFVEDRDFIVLEQRGTRHANPALDCPEFVEARQQAAVSASSETRIALQVTAATRCRARLEASGVDLAAYSTAASAADVEDLRRVLGIGQWTLYGISYGTKLALSIMRNYPETIRAAVLVSVLPPQVHYDDESAANLDNALGLAFQDCQADEPCRTAFPDLRKRFYDTLAAADATPVRVTVQSNEDPVERILRGADLAGLVDLTSASSIAAAPRLLDGIARRDTSVIGRAVAGMLWPSTFAWGMRLSVWCAEELPFAARSTASGPGLALGGLESAVVAPEVCAAWGVPTRPLIESEPVESDVPTLLISGEYDPETPPSWAAEAARTLVNNRIVVFRGAGHVPTHEWDGDGCAMRLAGAFVAAPSRYISPGASLPDCVAERTAPVFDTGGRR